MCKHYAAYHNVAKMGRTLQQGDPCRVISSKPLQKLEGATVWMIVGEGVKGQSRKAFSLGSVFSVTETGDNDDNDQFKHYACGTGTAFDPPIPLSNQPWFDEFRKSVRSFQGIHPINNPNHIAALQQLSRAVN